MRKEGREWIEIKVGTKLIAVDDYVFNELAFCCSCLHQSESTQTYPGQYFLASLKLLGPGATTRSSSLLSIFQPIAFILRVEYYTILMPQLRTRQFTTLV